MLDFSSVKQQQVSMNSFASALSLQQLSQLTIESVDRMLAVLEECDDADVTFVPDDPDAMDSAADDPANHHLSWTIAHIVVHATASGDEYAAVATELARGVAFHGRPRYETPWQSVTTVAACRQRLAESKRIRLASLDMWPDEPHLDVGYTAWDRSGWVNAKGIFAWGLAHDDDHIRQLSKIVAQLKAAR